MAIVVAGTRLYSVQPLNIRHKDDSVTLEILSAIEESSELTQRHLAQRLGVALGLANSYLKRCARKGLIKVQQAPANRYLYYLTPQGFAEKSRLTAEYLRYSLSFYRRASDSVIALFGELAACERRRVLFCGVSDLAEIAVLRAGDFGLDVVGVLDAETELPRWMGKTVWRQLPPAEWWDVCLVTDLQAPQQTWLSLVEQVGPERVIAPDVLGIDVRGDRQAQPVDEAGARE